MVKSPAVICSTGTSPEAAASAASAVRLAAAMKSALQSSGQISYATIENIASGAYIKQNDQTQGQKVDNKVKKDEIEPEEPKPTKKKAKKTEE